MHLIFEGKKTKIKKGDLLVFCSGGGILTLRLERDSNLLYWVGESCKYSRRIIGLKQTKILKDDCVAIASAIATVAGFNITFCKSDEYEVILKFI